MQQSPGLSPEPYPPLPPQSRRPAWVPWMLGCGAGCGVMLVLLVVGIFGLVRNLGKAVAPADSAAHQFLATVNQGKLDQAYAMTASTWKRTSSSADFADVANLWRKQVGSFQSLSLVGSNWYSGTGGAYLNLVYTVRGSKRTAQVRMSMVQEGGAWRPVGTYFQMQ